jgi:abortive infection bacteriophage resistance protein
METLTFGKLTSLYENLKDTEEKKQIASVYSTVVPLLESWLKSINYIRNCCAHHIRIWNKRIPIKPIIPRRKEKRFLEFIDEETDKKLYGVLCAIVYMTTQISPNSEVKKRLMLLFSEFHEVNIYYMGFHEKWKEEVFWN